MAQHVVLFGFEPFGAHPVNPSGVAVESLDGAVLHGVEVVGVVLPVLYAEAYSVLDQTLQWARPAAVLGVGQGLDCFAVERVACNVVGLKPDNDGVLLPGPVDASGPPALPTTLDTPHLLQAVRTAVGTDGPPCTLSDDAGTFLCNHTLYRLLRSADGRLPCGFLHVPTLDTAPQHLTTAAVTAATGLLCARAGELLTDVG
jgi:pyroglutamyl-peptidase